MRFKPVFESSERERERERESRSLTEQVAVSSKSDVRQCWTIVWRVTSVEMARAVVGRTHVVIAYPRYALWCYATLCYVVVRADPQQCEEMAHTTAAFYGKNTGRSVARISFQAVVGRVRCIRAAMNANQ